MSQNTASTPKLVFSKKIPNLKPKVTLGMCVKDCESSVRAALNSIHNQDFNHKSVELIVVDDGSKDRTLSVVLSLASEMDMSIKIFHSAWRGLGPARNVVVDNAGADFIIWVDGDMILPDDHVRKQVMFMERNPKVGIAKAKYAMCSNESIAGGLENVKFVVEDAFGSKLPGTGGSIVRVEAVREIGGFDNRLIGTGEDEDVAYRVRAKGWLLDRTEATFIEKRSKTWRDLWNKYFWYGYGDYLLYHKNRGIFSLTRMNPPAGFALGIIYAVRAYTLTRSAIVLLLPFHFAFKMTAWLMGFSRGKAEFS